MARDPNPEEVAQFTDTLEHLLASLELADREIMTLRLQSCTVPEISQETGRSERSVERVLARARRQLARMGAEAD